MIDTNPQSQEAQRRSRINTKPNNNSNKKRNLAHNVEASENKDKNFEGGLFKYIERKLTMRNHANQKRTGVGSTRNITKLKGK